MTTSVPDSAGVPADYTKNTLVAAYNDRQSVEELFQANPDKIAAVIVEPVAANMGVVLPEDGFLQFMIERLLSSDAPSEELPDEDEEESGDSMKLTSIQSITDFMNCAGRTLPDNIRLWARRNLLSRGPMKCLQRSGGTPRERSLL